MKPGQFNIAVSNHITMCTIHVLPLVKEDMKIRLPLASHISRRHSPMGISLAEGKQIFIAAPYNQGNTLFTWSPDLV